MLNAGNDGRSSKQIQLAVPEFLNSNDNASLRAHLYQSDDALAAVIQDQQGRRHCQEIQP